jgi:hypothetical protein
LVEAITGKFGDDYEWVSISWGKLSTTRKVKVLVLPHGTASKVIDSSPPLMWMKLSLVPLVASVMNPKCLSSLRLRTGIFLQLPPLCPSCDD